MIVKTNPYNVINQSVTRDIKSTRFTHVFSFNELDSEKLFALLEIRENLPIAARWASIDIILKLERKYHSISEYQEHSNSQSIQSIQSVQSIQIS